MLFTARIQLVNVEGGCDSHFAASRKFTPHTSQVRLPTQATLCLKPVGNYVRHLTPLFQIDQNIDVHFFQLAFLFESQSSQDALSFLRVALEKIVRVC